MDELALPRPYGRCNLHRWAAGRRMDWHQHDFLQLIHVLEGELVVDWGVGWRSLSAGIIHILPPGHRHRQWTPDGHRQFGVNFRPGDQTRGIAAAVLASHPQPTARRYPVATADLEALLDPDALDPSWPMRAGLLVDRYITGLLDLPPNDADPAGDLIAFLRRHRDGECSVAEAAAALGLSRASVQRLCKASFGCGVAALHRRLRIERATLLLRQGEAGIGAVADACGYADIYAFSRAYKQQTGLSPSAHRRQLRDGEI